MFRIRTYDQISPLGLEALPRDRYEVSSDSSRPDAILVRSSKLHNLEFPESLLAIARAGAGIDNIPVPRCTEKGIVVFNTPGANANAVAELVVAAFLMTSRRLVAGAAFCNTLKGSGDEVAKAAEQGKKHYGGQELRGKTLGVIGLGSIGGRVARLAASFGMQVIGYDPWLSVDHAIQLPNELKLVEYIQQVYSQSDYISVHVPLFEKTANFVNDQAIAQCKPGTRIFNFSRDGIVDNQAVLRGLASGQLAYYGTDFARPELLNHEKVLVFPHLGASTGEAEDNCAVMAAEEIRDFLEHGNVSNAVNYPGARVPRTTAHRLTVFTRNVPNMVGQISGILGAAKINIADLVNKSRGEVAYNIIDLDSPCGPEVQEKLRKIEGVVAVRLLSNG